MNSTVTPHPTYSGSRPHRVKRQGSVGRDDTDSIKHHDKRQKNKRSTPVPMDVDPAFSKLDLCDSVEAKRVQQRRKTIMKGKNTAGYAAYMEQVPKESRRLRNTATPSTPDHTLNIPHRRWLGIVKAWRLALHKYDPPDVLQQVTESSNNGEVPVVSEQKGSKESFGDSMSATPKKDAADEFFETDDNAMNDSSPISVLSEDLESDGRRQLECDFAAVQSQPARLQRLTGWGDLTDSDDDDEDLL